MTLFINSDVPLFLPLSAGILLLLTVLYMRRFIKKENKREKELNDEVDNIGNNNT